MLAVGEQCRPPAVWFVLSGDVARWRQVPASPETTDDPQYESPIRSETTPGGDSLSPGGTGDAA